jgi:peptidoglycan hydrolase-like protein with peptidoglycan-binding domain
MNALQGVRTTVVRADPSANVARLVVMMRRFGATGLLAVLVGCSASHHARTTDGSAGFSTTTTMMTAATATKVAAANTVRQPPPATLPAPPPGGLHLGSRGAMVRAYQRRLRQLRFDPGPVDGVYAQDTAYAAVAAEKALGLARDGVIGPDVRRGLEHFQYRPALPHAEGDRIEINLDTQVLTVYRQWQPILVTTTSTGSGEYFCGGSDGCQYAITPTGHFHLQYQHQGWDDGKLGRMWNPYYFNGGIAIHGLPSVPAYPASHGCARIPMDIANYFASLVTRGESVYVVGTAMKPGNAYVGPIPTTTTTTTVPTTTTTVPTTATHPTPTTRRNTTTTAPRTSPTTTHVRTTAP